MSEAAALTEQIADVLYEHMARTEKTGYIHGCKCGWSARPDKSYRTHVAAEIAARLADSRPVVSEAAIRACAIHLFTLDRDRKGRGLVDWIYASDYEKDFFTAEARAALTAALPHMGDGKGEADHTDLLGVSVTHAITEAETTNDVCECGHVRGWHDPANQQTGMCLWPNGWPDKRECKCNAFTPRLSPTGDDTP